MGFPLSQTPIFSFINALTDLQTIGYDVNNGHYIYESVIAFLRHPYTRQLSDVATSIERELTIKNRFFPLAERNGSCTPKKGDKGRLAALPQMPFPGLFHDGPPMARLRKLCPSFFYHRQRAGALSQRASLVGLITQSRCRPSPDSTHKKQPTNWWTVFVWLRGKDLNQRPPGYEPDELPAALPRDMLFASSA